MEGFSPLALSLAFGAAAAAANVIGGLVVVARRHWNEMFLKYFLGLGAGFMLAATFLRMLPASMALSPSAPGADPGRLLPRRSSSSTPSRRTSTSARSGTTT